MKVGRPNIKYPRGNTRFLGFDPQNRAILEYVDGWQLKFYDFANDKKRYPLRIYLDEWALRLRRRSFIDSGKSSATESYALYLLKRVGDSNGSVL